MGQCGRVCGCGWKERWGTVGARVEDKLWSADGAYSWVGGGRGGEEWTVDRSNKDGTRWAPVPLPGRRSRRQGHARHTQHSANTKLAPKPPNRNSAGYLSTASAALQEQDFRLWFDLCMA